MTPEITVMVLGVLAVLAWTWNQHEERKEKRTKGEELDALSALRNGITITDKTVTKQGDELISLTARVAKLEHVLQVDGSAAMAKARAVNIPNFMR